MDHTESVPMEYVTCLPSKQAGHYHVWTIPNQSQWNMLHVYPLNQLDTIFNEPYMLESVPMECVAVIPTQ